MDSSTPPEPPPAESPLQEKENPDPSSSPKKSFFKTAVLPLIVVTFLVLLLFFIQQKGTLNSLLHRTSNHSSKTEEARLWVHYGTLHHHAGEINEAIAAYQEAAYLDPLLFEAWWNLSLVQDALHQNLDQLASLQQAVHCRPDSPEAWSALTKVYFQLHQDSEALLSREQEELARKHATLESDREELAQKNPKLVEPWISWGMSHAITRFAQPLFFDSQTLQIFQHALEHHPRSPWIWAHLGLSSIKKQTEIAETPFITQTVVPDLLAFQKSAELQPQNPTLFFLLGRAAFWKKEYNTAINAFLIATHNPETHWLPWYALGETYLAANRPDEAIEAYLKAQNLSPDSLEIAYGIAEAYLQKGKTGEAQQLLSQINPEHNATSKPTPLSRRAQLQIHFRELHLVGLQDQTSPPFTTTHSTSPSPITANTPDDDLLPQEKESSSSSSLSLQSPHLTPDPIERSNPPLQHRSPQLPLNQFDQFNRLSLNSEKKSEKKIQPEPPTSSLPISTQPPEALDPDLHLRTSSPLVSEKTATPTQINEWKKNLLEKSLNTQQLKTIISIGQKEHFEDLSLLAAQQLVEKESTAPHWTTLGTLYALLNQPEKEIDSYLKALDIDPRHRDALYRIGLIYLQQNRWTKAQVTFQKIVYLHSNDTDSWFHLGIALQKQERWDESAQAYQKATILRPTDGAIWLNLASTYTAIQRPDLEIQTYKECLEINPDFQPAWNNLSLLLKKLGKSSDFDAFQKQIKATSR